VRRLFWGDLARFTVSNVRLGAEAVRARRIGRADALLPRPQLSVPSTCALALYSH